MAFEDAQNSAISEDVRDESGGSGLRDHNFGHSSDRIEEA